jgi:hypothetical protein
MTTVLHLIKNIKRYALTDHHAMKAYWGVEVWLHSFFDLGTRWGEWSASRPDRFTTKERAPGSHWIGSLSPFSAEVKKNVWSYIPFPHTLS